MSTPNTNDDALARSLDELTDRLNAGSLATLGERLSAVVTAAADLLHVRSVGLVLLDDDDADRIRCVAATGRAAEVLGLATHDLVPVTERNGGGPMR